MSWLYSSNVVGEVVIRVTVLAGRLTRGERGAGRTLVVAPVGGGNIGDQALFEACMKSIPSASTVVMKVRSGLDYEFLDTRDSLVVELPNLVYGTWMRNWIDLVRFNRHLTNADKLYFVGADTLDGAYSELASVNRLRIATVAALRGITTTVLGFSWNEAPNVRCERLLIRCADAGATLCVRDPESYERVSSLDVRTARLTADIVFTLVPESTSVEQQYERGQYCVVNASGLVERLVEGSADRYVDLIRQVLEQDMCVVLVPHVIRSGGDDLAVLREVHSQFRGDPRVTLVDTLLSPTEVMGLAEGARFVVTGRMHLAVMALRSGTPAITVATQGKVEGLLASLDCSELLVPADQQGLSGLGEAMRALIESESDIRTRVASALPAVLERAELNFSDTVRDLRRDPESFAARQRGGQTYLHRGVG
ncbi:MULTISPECIES: polysaccharide pyruvyl transferase family protein [unclassified Gordonia (in: high G+C Gram-positive bacteria)]|uniref:polysaccharide pyruvyl transferase family protein n=1 Tax=unclassified Gordonia (in: high G+C Gram-positive bacteria) TaxID=2657482 RepID=UPI0019640C10|nr:MULTISPECIES: polysaccharide pyruvyl transferase family protein [unclassified Gordonia (in: high G+C Gram-positive bacteria)]MBN0974526.1 polysaccharide pyruvyl transferase family protein [Gordonia sp. BP-119]MBN0984474.1 polysaccharide pyruvyl transferase family protein [Gordonia sp. BP-94]